MKRLAILPLLIFFCIGVCQAQVSSSTARRVRAGSSLPATCSATNPVDVFIRTGATSPGFYFCSAANTWSGPFVSLSAAAPSNATYITQTANSTLSAEQAMGSLATGLVKNTTTTGVQSIATATDVSTPVQCADAGASDTYACNLAPAPASYVVGTHLRFFANTANTGAATINFNSLGALTLVKVAGGITTGLSDNDIRAGQWVDCVIASGSNCQVQSTLGNAPSAGITNGASNGQVPISDGTNLTGDPDLTFATDTLTATKVATTNVSNPSGNLTLVSQAQGNIVIANGSVTIAADNRANGTHFFGFENYRSGSGGVIGFSSSTTPASASNDSGMSRLGAASLAFGNGTAGDFSASLKFSNMTVTGLATDATHTTRTLCEDTTSHVIYFGSGANGVCLGTSSVRYKHGIGTLNKGLKQILALQPKTFHYNKGYGDDGARLQYGFLAEDVVKVMPDAVGLDANGQPNSVDTIKMFPVMVNAITELNARVERVEKENRRLRRLLRRR